ncbi:MAG: PilZ domain-containing protein [Phycisphaeraceae bacterium]
MSALVHHHGIEPRPDQPTPSLRTGTAREQRLEPRLKLPAMYTLVRVRLVGETPYHWTGHIYDVSLSGMRFELDEPLLPDSAVEIRAILPGQPPTLVRAAGHVVRLHEDEPNTVPVRHAMRFDEFASTIDRHRLRDYLASAGLSRRAAVTKRRAA